jgi:hypothetical protein
MPRPTTPTLAPYTSQLPDVNNPATWAERTPLFWNWVTGPGYTNLDDLLTYSEDAIDYVDTALAGSESLVDAVAAIQAQLSGRNAIINGDFGINQRAVSGTVTLSAGAYGHDRWKAGASGCTYTFATSANVTTLTITASSLIQVIEGVNLDSGTYVLSWTGTAQGKIGAGSYSASGVTGSATGGTNLSIEFNTGTVSLVQFEKGSVVTPFERRSRAMEDTLCRRYYCEVDAEFVFDGILGTGSGGVTVGHMWVFPVQMRSVPTVSVVSQSGTEAGSLSLTVKGTTGVLGKWEWLNSNVVIARAKAAVIRAESEL